MGPCRPQHPGSPCMHAWGRQPTKKGGHHVFPFPLTERSCPAGPPSLAPQRRVHDSFPAQAESRPVARSCPTASCGTCTSASRPPRSKAARSTSSRGRTSTTTTCRRAQAAWSGWAAAWEPSDKNGGGVVLWIADFFAVAVARRRPLHGWASAAGSHAQSHRHDRAHTTGTHAGQDERQGLGLRVPVAADAVELASGCGVRCGPPSRA